MDTGGIQLSGVLPNLLVIGVPKAGTGSLFSYLGQHPDICASTVKEIGYFKLPQEKTTPPTLKWYGQHFAHYGGERYVLEATPSYCYLGKRVIDTIEDTLDRPRAIILLRDPVDRLWSAYTFQRTIGNLGHVQSFQEYLSECERRRREGSPYSPYFAGMSIGFYGDYLPDWFELLGERMQAVFTEELLASPQQLVGRLCRWLSIDAAVVDSFDYHVLNKTIHPRSVALSRAARAIARKTGPLLKRTPLTKEWLRANYRRMNTGELTERLDQQTRRRLEEMYAPSNRIIATTLRERGFQELPPWLERAERSQTA